jgi:hypothetical protein
MSNDLMQKLAISKKIMDKHNEVPRGQNQMTMMTENSNVNYNITENITENQVPQKIQETISTKPVTKDAVLNSKLPDEIKKLMLENPIIQPQMNGATLSDEIIEGAARLMNNNGASQKGSLQKEGNTTSTNTSSLPNNNDLKQMIRDVVRDTVRDVVREELQNSGMIVESTKNTNEMLSLKVGSHIFEGKVLKIKKVKQ